MQPAARARQEPVLWGFLQSSWAGHFVLSEAKCPSVCSKDNAAFCNPLGGCVGKGGGKVFERTLYSLSRFFPIRAFSPFHSLCSANSICHSRNIVPDYVTNCLQYNANQLKKNALCESCKLSVIWGKMRAIAQETAPRITLRKCSKEAGGRSVYMWVWQRKNTCNQVCIKLFSVGVESQQLQQPMI